MPWLPVLPIFLSINSFLWSQGLPVISWHAYLLNLLSASRMDKYHKKGCKSDIGATSSFFIKLKRKKKMNDGIKVLHGLKGICESCREMDFWLAVECSRNEHQEELESRISSGLWFGAQHYSEDQLSSFFHWVRAKWRKLGSKSTNKKSWRLIYTCSRVTLGNPEGCASTVVESILGCATLLLKSSDDRVTAIPWFCDSVE